MRAGRHALRRELLQLSKAAAGEAGSSGIRADPSSMEEGYISDGYKPVAASFRLGDRTLFHPKDGSSEDTESNPGIDPGHPFPHLSLPMRAVHCTT